METAISIPTYEWIRGGINRAVARRAFADILPSAIIERTSKGGPGSFAAKVYRANRPRVRELLLDGKLVARGIVDRGAVEKATSQGSADSLPEMVRLLALVDAEAWVGHWAGLASG
jgi:asparagine synthase (glutamine-hydrolysing)